MIVRPLFPLRPLLAEAGKEPQEFAALRASGADVP